MCISTRPNLALTCLLDSSSRRTVASVAEAVGVYKTSPRKILAEPNVIIFEIGVIEGYADINPTDLLKFHIVMAK